MIAKQNSQEEGTPMIFLTIEGAARALPMVHVASPSIQKKKN